MVKYELTISNFLQHLLTFVKIQLCIVCSVHLLMLSDTVFGLKKKSHCVLNELYSLENQQKNNTTFCSYD